MPAGSPAPIAVAPRQELESHPQRPSFDVVLLAERFDAAGRDALRAQLVELGELCGPALARAAELDRFPVRTLLAWSDRWTALRQPGQATRPLAIAAAIAATLAALVFIPCDFEIEAPATLAAAVERDVFATASGAVAEVHVKHGQTVAQGDVLVVLSDPELALKLQETRGESAGTRKRLEALAVARTDRTLREDKEDQRLPLSAEQRELEEKLASLDRQLTLLEARSESLVLKSPHAGTVLTLDVQSLLESRPVERGQVLLTIADATSGWELKANVPQRQIGHVLEAESRSGVAVGGDLPIGGRRRAKLLGPCGGSRAPRRRWTPITCRTTRRRWKCELLWMALRRQPHARECRPTCASTAAGGRSGTCGCTTWARRCIGG